MEKGRGNRNKKQKPAFREVSKPNRTDILSKNNSGIPYPAKYVFLLFLVSCIVHILLNSAVNEAPKIVIDEGLYTNIARSLAWDGELAFRGQPVNYPYLLYSFLLVPVYWLNRIIGGDVYRYIQFFNTILVTSSVFPAFCFARDFTKDRAKAFFTAVIVSLMPDMIMGGYLMTECLIWPLSLWMAFFGYRFYEGHQLKDGLLTALFAGLMFSCKPGAVAMGISLLIIAVFFAVKSKSSVKNPLLSVVFLIVCIGIVYGIFLLLYNSWDSVLGLYEKQTSEWKSEDALVAAEAFFLSIFLFVFACGGFFGIYPYTHLTGYSDNKRRFVVASAIGICAAIAGTAIFVVPYKWYGGLGQLPLHLRYCSMYIPWLFVFTIDLDHHDSKGKSYLIAIALFILLSLFPGARAGFVPGKSGSIDLIALNAFATTRNLNGRITGWIVTILVVIASFVFLRHAMQQNQPGHKSSINKSVFKFANCFFVVFILINAICAHVNANIYIDPKISADALEVNNIVGSQECLGVTQRYYDDIYSYWLESRLNVPMQQVTIDQMFIKMEESNGIYDPFVPVDQAPNVGNHETPDTDIFVLGMTIAEHLELSDNIVSSTKTENGNFTIVQIDPSVPWVDTMMYGMDDNALYPDSPAYIRVFNSNRNIDGNITIELEASGSGSLCVSNETIPVENQAKTYEITIPYSEDIPVSAQDGTIQIYRYSTQYKDGL